MLLPGPRIHLFALLSLGLLVALKCASASYVLGWDYSGCYAEPQGQRYLNETFYALNDMTIPLCLQHCGDLGLPYAALEFQFQCFCGAHLTVVSPAADSSCAAPCLGASDQVCGGMAGFMSLYLYGVAGAINPDTTARTSDPSTTSPAPSPAESSTSAAATSSSVQEAPSTLPTSTSAALESATSTSGAAPQSSAANALSTSSSVSTSASSDAAPDSANGDDVGSAGSLTPSSLGSTVESTALNPLPTERGTTSPSPESSIMTSGNSTATATVSASTIAPPLLPTFEKSQIKTGGVNGSDHPRFHDPSQAIVFGKYLSSASGVASISHLAFWTFISALYAALS